MANSLNKNTSEIVLKKFIMGFMDDRVLLNTVETQCMKGVINPSTGDSVQFKRPHQYNAVRTPSGDITGQSNDIISATATARISDYITIDMGWTQLEQAIQLNQLEQILAPARDKMITEYESELAQYMINNTGLVSGTPDQPIDAWGDVAGTKSYLHALGVKGDCYGAMNPWSTQDLADTQSGLASGDNELVNAAWRRARLSRDFGGVQAYNCNSLGSYTMGTSAGAADVTVDASPTVTYSALKDTYQVSVTLSGLPANATINAGQQVQFDKTLMLNQQNKNPLSRRGAGVPFVGTVTADVVADGAGDAVVVLSGAPIFDATAPQYNTVSRAITAGDAVTMLGTADETVQPGLFYGKGFVGTGTVELPKLHSWDSSVISVDGISMRATKYSDPKTNTQSMRIDLLPAYCVFNPLMGGQFFGNA